jgi:glycyl-tRNA synthetase
MDKLVALCKRRGYIFPGSEIYGGVGSTYDYGPLGVLLLNNIKQAWWRDVVQLRTDMVGLDAAILMNAKVWEASGHVAGFTDPLVDCKGCRKRYRADHLVEAAMGDGAAEMTGLHEPKVDIKDLRCPKCGGEFTDVRHFNGMFKTTVGPVEDAGSVAYLRPETAQGIFVNFKNVLDTARKRLPLGIAQVGKAFRNEITPGNFIFRTREFEQMEIEYFVKPGTDEEHFEYWKRWNMDWFLSLGLKAEHLRFFEHPREKLSHYSKRTVDVEYLYPWGWGELNGVANRTDFDLKAHTQHSGQDLSYFDDATGERYVPYVIEPTFGVTRTLLAVLLDAFEEVDGGRTETTDSSKEAETVLRLHPRLAPIKAAVLPLAKKEPLREIAEGVRAALARKWMVQYDEAGTIGRRYRRQDEIGTPWCICVDFDTPNDNAVTVRDRDTMEQVRVPIAEVERWISGRLEG